MESVRESCKVRQKILRRVGKVSKRGKKKHTYIWNWNKTLAVLRRADTEISPNIFICVSSFNNAAIRLYKEFGFKLIGELDNFVKDGFTELLFRKTVGPMMGYDFDDY